MFVFYFLIESLIESLAGLAVAVALPLLDVAGWVSGPTKCGWLCLHPSQMWLAWPPSQPSVAGWAFGPAKCGCQNKKVAAHMCAACGRFSDPD